MFKRIIAKLKFEFPLIFIITVYLFGQVLGLFIHYYFINDSPKSVYHVQRVLLYLSDNPRVYVGNKVKLKLLIVDGELKGHELRCDAVSVPGRNIEDLKKGDYFFAALSLKNVDWKLEFYDSSFGRYPECKLSFVSKKVVDQGSYLRKIKARIISFLEKTHLDPVDRSIMLSMSIGDDSDLSRQDWELFKKLGLAHLLVVSGYQISLIYFSLVFLFKKLFVQFASLVRYFNLDFFVNLLALFFALNFAFLVGMDAACQRASIALCIIVVNSFLDRKVRFINIVLSTFLIDISISPLSFLLPGTQLTYAALLGFAFASVDSKANGFFIYFKATIFATLFTSIVSIIRFDQFYPIAFLTNLVLSPIASFLACQLGFLTYTFNLLFEENFRFLLEINLFLISLFRKALLLIEPLVFNFAGVGALIILILIAGMIVTYYFFRYLRLKGLVVDDFTNLLSQAKFSY